MNVKLTARWFYGALIVLLSAWILHSFVEALLAACVTAIASWPLYTRFAASVPRRMRRSTTALIFTLVMSVCVLAPLIFAVGAMLTETHALLLDIAAADKKGIAFPHWLLDVPLAGPWIARRWARELASPGGLVVWAQHIDSTFLLTWAQSVGQFMARHAFIIGFTILLLFFLYQHGASLAEEFRRWLRCRIGEQCDAYINLATRAVRALVNSMLLVALFDGFAAGVVYVIASVPHAILWAAITGSLALVPFLGYAAVGALTLQTGDNRRQHALSFALGSLVLFFGDKILRPIVARDGTRLPFVWILIGCLGGFEVLGLIGVVVGPVVLTLARELWAERVRELAASEVTRVTPAVESEA